MGTFAAALGRACEVDFNAELGAGGTGVGFDVRSDARADGIDTRLGVCFGVAILGGGGTCLGKVDTLRPGSWEGIGGGGLTDLNAFNGAASNSETCIFLAGELANF